MKSITVDTNAFSALAKGDSLVKKVVELADDVLVPVMVIAELKFGFKNGTKESYNNGLLQEFLSLPRVETIHTTDRSAQIYAELATSLKRKGKPIPINDIWIAALAMEHNSVVVTYDKHFLIIEELKVWHEI